MAFIPREPKGGAAMRVVAFSHIPEVRASPKTS